MFPNLLTELHIFYPSYFKILRILPLSVLLFYSHQDLRSLRFPHIYSPVRNKKIFKQTRKKIFLGLPPFTSRDEAVICR